MCVCVWHYVCVFIDFVVVFISHICSEFVVVFIVFFQYVCVFVCGHYVCVCV